MIVLFKESSNIIDITNKINRYKSDTYLMSMATTDALYIGSDFPLNHLFVKMGNVKNDNASNIIIDYYSNDVWTSVVKQNDGTESFSQSGFIDFTPDRDNPWLMKDTNSNSSTVTELESVVVYDKYWIRITVDSDMDNSIELEYIGHVFSDDIDLYSEYPIFNDSSLLGAFEASKIDWEEQHVKAADLIIQDMKRKNVIIGAEQILDRSVFLPASVCKVAEIIFNAFGNDYRDQLLRSKAEYSSRMDLSKYFVDINSNGILEHAEVGYKQGWLSR